MDYFLIKFRWWLLRKLIPTPEIEHVLGNQHIGPCMVMRTPTNLDKFTHDANRAFHCGDYTYFFYKEVREWKGYRDSLT